MGDGLRIHEGGSGEPVLLLLHGLGATGDVWERWRPLLARKWPGRWLAPDLPGHGGSLSLPAYTFDGLAAVVAGIVPSGAPLTVLGHSLGGVVGLALAGGMLPVRTVIGLGIKVAWTDEDLERARKIARRPVAWFDSRDEAADRYLRVSGLAGLLAADDPAVDAGLREQDGKWRLAADPGTFGVGAPDMPSLLANAKASVTLARGELDPMNTDEQLSGLGVPVVTPGSATMPTSRGRRRACGYGHDQAGPLRGLPARQAQRDQTRHRLPALHTRRMGQQPGALPAASRHPVRWLRPQRGG